MGTTRMALSSRTRCMLAVLVFVLQMVQSQNKIQSSSDMYVDPFGSTTLQCRIDPSELPPDAAGLAYTMFVWKFRKDGSPDQDLASMIGNQKFTYQKEFLELADDRAAGIFNLVIKNVSYDRHDGDYSCVITVAVPGTETKPFRSQPFHLYVKYQPQAPHVEFSVPSNDLREGQKANISCSSRDGNPPPEITWMRDGTMVPSVYTAARRRQDVSRADLVLDLTKDHNKAVYTCLVKNSAIAQPLQKVLDPLDVKYAPQLTISASVGPAYVPLRDLSNGVTLEQGTEALLSCSSDANPPASLPSWRKNHQVLLPGSQNFSFPPGTLTPELAGNYFCVAFNGVGGEKSSEIQVNVLHGPVVTVGPSLTLREGESGSLVCRVESNPRVESVEWYNALGQRVGLGDFVLGLREVRKSDAGNYECRAKVQFSPSGGNGLVMRQGRGTGRVDVHYRPGAAVIEPDAPRATIGSTVSMHCSAPDPGHPAARFRWRKLDRGAADRSSMEANLTISGVRLDDNGDYECTPTNEVGDGQPKVVRLEVSEPAAWVPNQPYNEENVIRKISDSPLSLWCTARGKPAPTFKWFKGGKEISDDDRWYRAVTEDQGLVDRYSHIVRSALKFEGPARTDLFAANDTLQRTDRGQYICQASNDAGQPLKRESHVLIQYPPVFRSRYSKVAIDIQPSASARIECLVESRPPAEIRWTRNGVPVTTAGRIRVETPETGGDNETFRSTIIMDSPTDADLGDYVCSASNIIGSETKPLSLVRRSVPDGPRNLKQKDLTYNGVMLTWDPSFDGGYSQKFTVVMTKQDGSIQDLSVNSPDATQYQVIGLMPLNRYNFRLKSRNQLGESRGLGENLDVVTPVKPVLPEDIPQATTLKYDPGTGVVSFATRQLEKPLALCAMIDVKKKDGPWTPVARCIAFTGDQGTYTIPGPPVADYHPRLRFCLHEKQDVCGEYVDENTIVAASTMPSTNLNIILPVVIIGGLIAIACMIGCIVCKRRSKKLPVKTAKTSNMTLTSNGSLQNGGSPGMYADGYTNKALQEANNGGFGVQNGTKYSPYNASDIQFTNGALYAQIDKKLNGDLVDGGMYRTDLHGHVLNNDGSMYIQPYPNYDDGYGHQHSPLEPNYTHVPVEVSGLPDPYEEYEKTPSFGEESVESGYSTSNSRGRRVIREIIV